LKWPLPSFIAARSGKRKNGQIDNTTILKSKFFATIPILFCFALASAQTKKYETKDYLVSYPEKFNLQPKEGQAIFSGFYLVRRDSTSGFNEPVAMLSVTDCSRLGMGPKPILENLEKGKTVTKRKTSSNKTDFDGLGYSEDGFEILEYIFLKDGVVYDLKGYCRESDGREYKLELEALMNSFDLK
jgi:hypothetical protein